MQQYDYLGDESYLPLHSASSIYLTENHLVYLPIIYLHDVVLYPGESLPLRSFDSNLISYLTAHQQDIFGVLLYSSATIGTIVQIRSGFIDDTSSSVVGEGKQRFQLLELIQRPNEILQGQVQILPERDALPFPQQLKKYPNTAYWRNCIYKYYDGDYLVYWIQKQFQSVFQPTPANRSLFRRTHIPQNVRLFSYWLAANIPLSMKERQQLLELNCPIQRLRRLIPVLQNQQNTLKCKYCRVVIAHKRNIFSMSEKVVGTFVNPNGYVHQMLTVNQIEEEHISLSPDPPCYQDSWFPGYGWTILNCGECFHHLGWKFTSTEHDPCSFYGLRPASLTCQTVEID